MDLKKQLNFSRQTPYKKDINLFLVHKNGKDNSGKKDLQQILTVGVCCLLTVLAVYAGIYFYELTLNVRVKEIEKYLSLEEVVKLSQNVNLKTSENELLYSYLGVIRNANEGFKGKLIIDSDVLKAIANSLPGRTRITTAAIATEIITLNCISSNQEDAIIVKQAIEKTGLFTHVSYNSVAFDNESGDYQFVISCYFKEVEIPTETSSSTTTPAQ